jgi:hypothetical protein
VDGHLCHDSNQCGTAPIPECGGMLSGTTHRIDLSGFLPAVPNEAIPDQTVRLSVDFSVISKYSQLFQSNLEECHSSVIPHLTVQPQPLETSA